MATLSIPEGLDVVQQGDSVVIRRSWRTWAVIPICFFLVFWFGFLGFWYYHAFTDRNAPLIMVLFPLLHVAVGFGLLYFVICSFVNSTDVTISTASVKIATGPLPWMGNCEVGAADIRGLVIRERMGNKGGVTYTLMYVDGANRERRLMRASGRREQLEFVANSIRQILGIGNAAPA